MIGKIVANYEITAELGHGGMGEVYQARDLRLGRPVALKFLSPKRTRDAMMVERFVREARAASALNHPNIVTIYDVGESGDGRFIVMEFIQGRTLRAVARAGLPLEELVDISVQVAEALAVAHSAGIVHRDIKPENIMVRDDGYVKVLDFGLARLSPQSVGEEAETEAATEPGVMLGTVRYMSPEQGRGETVTSATDVFSLGVVMYELAAGRHPFEADSNIGVLQGILSQSPMPPSRLRAGLLAPLEALVLTMLEKDARLRPGAAQVTAALSESRGKNAAAMPLEATGSVSRRMVGRKKELKELLNVFEAAQSGRGHIVCITGEPGLGKTTLVEDFFADLAARGVGLSIGRGRSSERLAGSEAYLPFLESLESLLHGESAEWVSRIMKLVAPTWYVQIAPFAAEDSSFARIQAQAKAASQERMKRELLAFLEEISRPKPLVLFYDDLHWADLSTVDMLSYIGSKCGSTRLLLIGTYRPSELMLGKSPFLQVKLELQSRGLCREIPLEFLSREDVDAYLDLEFPENRFPNELSALIHAKTEGSPLFMADVIRYLRDRGVIVNQNGSWALAQSLPNIDHDLPESIRSMIQRKMDQLADTDRRLLAAASVQGHEFNSAVVANAVEMDAAQVEERLEALDRIHSFVRMSGEREFPDSSLTLRYSFVHVLYQNAFYAGLTATRKASLSAAVARALVAFYGEQSSEVAAELALLFEVARDFASASDYFVIAAKNTAAVAANQEAIALIQRSIACATRLRGEARNARVEAAATELARIYDNLSRFPEAAEAFDLAEKAIAERNDTEARIQAICGKANALFLSKQMERCREEIRRALDLARLGGSSKALATAEIIQAQERLCAGDFEQALSGYERAIPVLSEKGLAPSSLTAVNFRGALHAWSLEHREAESVLGWSLKRAREAGARARILQNYFVQAISFGHEGRLGESFEHLREAQRVAELNGERFVLARIPNTLGWLHRESLDLEGALELDLEGVRLSREVGDNEAEINSHINAGQVYLLLGEPACSFEHLEQAGTLLDRFNWFTWLFRTRLEAELASYWIARGELKRAAAHALASLEIAERSLMRKYLAWARKLLGDIAALEDRVGDAAEQYDLALCVLDRHPCPTVEWRIRAARAEMAQHLRDRRLAEEHAGRSRSIIESLANSISDESLRKRLLSG